FYTGSQTGDTYSVNGSDGSYFIVEGAGTEFITITGDGSNTVTGGAGTDSINISGGGNNTFIGGDGTYKVSLGTGNDNIQLGNGTDVVYGSPGNDTIVGGTGQDTFDYQKGDYPTGSNQIFGDFNGFKSGTLQTIKGGHTSFVTDSGQNIIKLPGSPNDYTISVNFQNQDALASTVTTITTSGTDGFPSGISFNTTDIEKVKFASQITNQVTLTGGRVVSEMLQLASEVYKPNFAIGLSNLFGGGSEPLAYQGASPAESTAAEAAGWHAVSAMELGVAPADFG